MAENPTLPQTDIEIIQKYPDSGDDPKSFRLDFPDFKEVCQTTFAKGTIIDDPNCFKLTNDDPITVESMVKVEGDFGESDYIPIFYHPKEFYWDYPLGDPPVKATDFDEETGAFKLAWQSFRSGDEVVVMLKEKVPVAVMGHADGVPRLGEDVFKLQMADPPADPDPYKLDPNPYYFSINRTKRIELPPKGTAPLQQSNPDAFATYSPMLPDKGPPWWPEGPDMDYGLKLKAAVAESGVEVTERLLPDDLLPPLYKVDDLNYHEPFYMGHFEEREKWYWKVVVWAFAVGPIAIAIYTNLSKREHYRKYYRASIHKNGHGTKDETGTYGPYLWEPEGTLPHEFTCDEDKWWNEEDYDIYYNFWYQDIPPHSPPFTLGAQTKPPPYIFEANPTAPIINDKDPWYKNELFLVKAGLYRKNIIEEILTSVGGSPYGAYLAAWEGNYPMSKDWWPGSPEGMIKQTSLTVHMDLYSRWRYCEPNLDFSTYACPSEFNFYTRPHTKAEMEAAGMWPAPA